MQHLPNLFKLLQLTRTQPQYGYTIAGLYKDELSDLAQHHYLVTFIAWQLARQSNLAGAKLDMEKVMAIALTHDLGELFGSDISRQYGRANPKARTAAKAFEAVNHKFLEQFFGPDQKYIKKIFAEVLEDHSDEAVIAKIADYVEVVQYLLYLKRFKKFDLKVIREHTDRIIKRIKNPIVKNESSKFLQIWFTALADPKYQTLSIGELINNEK